MTDDELIEAAKAIRKNAYCPQSNFYVGAAIIDETGKLYIGCNVENAAYPQSSCAEAGAISAMIAGGGQRICTIAIAGGTAHHTTSCTPCGGCRQRISEFADTDTRIIVKGNNNEWQSFTLRHLLPEAFSSANL